MILKKFSKKPRKPTNWLSTKASSLRSSWKKRLTRTEFNDTVLPTLKEIKEFLETKKPYICEYEQIELSENDAGFDHDIPISRGGSFGLENIVICSKVHNTSKGDLTGSEYKQLLKLIRTWEDSGEKFLARLRAASLIFNRRKRRYKK